MAAPLTSVVIPTFNRAHVLTRTLDSVFAQTYEHVEAIVVDDGSNDGTGDVLRERYRGESRLRYLRQENRGVCAARNRGLEAARGEFVALLDSDDVWLPWKLELQLACMDRAPQIGMVWTDMDAVNPDGSLMQRKFLRTMYGAYRWFTADDLFEESWSTEEIRPGLVPDACEARFYVGDLSSAMVMGNLVHTSTVVLRRDRLARVGGFNVELHRSGEDYDFHLRTCREGPVGFVDCSSVLYTRGAEDQLTGPDFDIDRAENFLRTIEPLILEQRASIKLPDWMLTEVLAEAHEWVGEKHWEAGHRRQARFHLIESLRRKRNQPRAAMLLVLLLLPKQLSRQLLTTYHAAKKRLSAK